MNPVGLLPLAGLMGLGGPEILLLLVVLLLLFGGAKLPALARGIGQSLRELKRATSADDAVPKEKTPPQ
jgi:sec-independent protein translocase protein TatA